MKFPPFWATTLTLTGLVVLCSLGAWQLQRLAWKNDIIAKLEAAYNTENPHDITFENRPAQFTYGRIKGRFLPDKALLLGPPKIRNEKPGLELIVPLEAQNRTILINMGWTPHPLDQQPIYHLQNKTITFYGLLRFPPLNAFTPQNAPQDHIWYRLNTTQIEQEKDLNNLYNAYLLADRSDHKFDAAFFSDQNKNRLMPNNNHLQYAFFWFALAGALAVIYVLRFIVQKPD